MSSLLQSGHVFIVLYNTLITVAAFLQPAPERHEPDLLVKPCCHFLLHSIVLKSMYL